MIPYSFEDKNWDKIPEELSKLSRWIAWKYINKKYFDGVYRLTKVPISVVTHANFKRIVDECVSLSDLKKIFKAYRGDDLWAGIGFSSHGDENILVLDFDDCLDNLQIKSDVLKNLIYQLNSYTEISPSGKGLRVFVKYNSTDKIFYSFQVISERGVDFCNTYKCKGIEIWNKNKFATVTGKIFDENLNKINSNDIIINDFLNQSRITLENFFASLKLKPKRPKREKILIEDCSYFVDEENFWDFEEEYYSMYNEDEYEDPFNYVNTRSLKDGTYQDNTPLV